MKKRIILIGISVLLITLVIVFFNNRATDQQAIVVDDVALVVDVEDPIDPTSDFFKSWLDALKSTTTNPVASNLTSSEFLSESVQKYIIEALSDTTRTVDPVICQTVIPERIGIKVSYVLETKAQLLVKARGSEKKSSELTVVDLVVVGNKWQITSISCSSGETAPAREFSFENEGFLLKSVPPPLNPDYWHLVFEENGQDGHTAPLFFSSVSMCTTIEGAVAVCDETQFKDATKALVQGGLTEAGVDVKNVILLKE